MHQEPFETNITANRLDRSAFIIMNDKQIETLAQRLVAIVEEREAAGEKTDITGSIWDELARILKHNNCALIDPVEKRREERKKRIQNTKNHIYDVGKAVVGGIAGASLYSRIQSRKRT